MSILHYKIYIMKNEYNKMMANDPDLYCDMESMGMKFVKDGNNNVVGILFPHSDEFINSFSEDSKQHKIFKRMEKYVMKYSNLLLSNNRKEIIYLLFLGNELLFRTIDGYILASTLNKEILNDINKNS